MEDKEDRPMQPIKETTSQQPIEDREIMLAPYVWEWEEVADHWVSYVRVGDEVVGCWESGTIIYTKF